MAIFLDEEEGFIRCVISKKFHSLNIKISIGFAPLV